MRARRSVTTGPGGTLVASWTHNGTYSPARISLFLDGQKQCRIFPVPETKPNGPPPSRKMEDAAVPPAGGAYEKSFKQAYQLACTNSGCEPNKGLIEMLETAAGGGPALTEVCSPSIQRQPYNLPPTPHTLHAVNFSLQPSPHTLCPPPQGGPSPPRRHGCQTSGLFSASRCVAGAKAGTDSPSPLTLSP